MECGENDTAEKRRAETWPGLLLLEERLSGVN